MSPSADDIERRLRDLEVAVATMEATVEQRLRAGADAFESQRQAMASLAETVGRQAPKPMSNGKIIGIVFSLVALVSMVVGAFWTLSERLSETRQLQDRVETHSHPDLGNQIQKVQTMQTEQSVELREFRRTTERDLSEIKSAVRIRSR